VAQEKNMTQHLYTHTIDTAFEAAVGSHGASSERFDFWMNALAPKITDVFSQPQREAAPLFALPSRTDDLAEIEAIAKKITDRFSTLVVVGMGGSSLSGETLTQMRRTSGVALHFLDNIDPHTMDSLVKNLNFLDSAFLIISKSGGTVETLAQMATLLRCCKSAVGEKIGEHFFIITIPNHNPLHTIAKMHNMHVLAHDVDLGGRFSVLSAVGLIPACVAGLDIRALRRGAQKIMADTTAPARCAAMHMALMEKDIRVNVTMHYCDRLSGLANWYRQCWAESLGKCQSVTTPVRSRGATDQHSQLQLYLEGPTDKLFTMVMLESAGQGALIDYEGGTDARLDFLKGRTLGDLMVAQQRATITTLIKRGRPVRSFMIKELNEETMGALLMHFALEVIFVAQLLGVNAFDQPAVEDSKVFALQYLAEA
jgi:glucose-6-phosphate isomerase